MSLIRYLDLDTLEVVDQKSPDNYLLEQVVLVQDHKKHSWNQILYHWDKTGMAMKHL